MSVKIGRNDLCHCGSGKKYKHCHLDLDAVARRPVPTTGIEGTPPGQTASSKLENTIRELEQLLEKCDDKQKADMGRILARTAPLRVYLSRAEEIQAAMQVLNSHQDEFLKLASDGAALQKRVEALFAEDRFAPLRFTPDNLQSAFDIKGSPMALPKEKLKEHCNAVILYLANEEYRTFAGVNLLLALPDYVAAGRYIDGCVVVSCARLTTDDPASANPFLWQMFVHGHQAWTADKQSRLGAGGIL
jgi:hypothetical protein